MKNKRLEVIHQTSKDAVVDKPLKDLIPIKPTLNFYPADPSNSGSALPGTKFNDDEMRERYRI